MTGPKSMQDRELRRILIANDALDGMEVALRKSVVIEHCTGSELLVAEALYDRIAEEPHEVLPPEEQARLIEALKAAERQALRRLLQPFRSRVACLDSRLLWVKRAAEGLVELASNWHADLLIKPVSEHHRLGDYLHTPLDWTLTRCAPCPVLISRSGDWEQPRSVLAAVDTGDDGHAPLNRQILSVASLMARWLGTTLHLVTAYPDLGQRVDELQVADDFAGIKGDMREHRERTMASLVDELELVVADIHFLEGKPGQLIPALAKRLQTTVTVVGTAARRGMSKLVIGNTAEDIIGRLEGDLITVREGSWS